MRAIVGIPVAGVIVLLMAITVGAGRNPGFMEDYHILLLNTSALGQGLIPTATDGGNHPSTSSCGPIGGALGKLCADATGAVGSAVGSGAAELSSLDAAAAESLRNKIGLQQWYSFHVLDICQGLFTPNATAPRAAYNATSCTQSLQTSLFNISALIDRQLGAGPLHLSLADLGLATDLQDGLDKLSNGLKILAYLYITAIALSAVSLCLSVFWLCRRAYKVSWANFWAALLTALVLLVANTIVVIGGGSVSRINGLGNKIGLSLSSGEKFAAITWASFALALLLALIWACTSRLDLKARRLNRQATRWASQPF
ncbi:uncharacterized protein E0L32_004647 [Thyridium curvatum]|uniref:Uncharacterized protein n=1 Tax=Thyridium curvatum TaxID=1093900 RepID=A0A507BFP8_9PEZI|nr:uncharacterized protein E0L32_004647 [Thyridium curvatum]TPX15370.1 hypothetical protein E0L32_004647 [Thyridium curvatum]